MPDDDYIKEPIFGMPLLPCQRPLGGTRMTNSLGTLMQETLVLPNVTFMFDYEGPGVPIGRHICTSPQYARQVVDEQLAAAIEHMATCDCPQHQDRELVAVEPEEWNDAPSR